MSSVTNSLPRVSTDGVERFLAALLAGLRGTYALGAATSGIVLIGLVARR
ncbi:hypothetical protein [Haloferax prahovense]|nr:hypothetical protein [Haloferax prahovense]